MDLYVLIEWLFMDALAEIAVMLALTGSMSVAAYFLKMLTWGGAAASFFIGAVVGVFGDVEWFILLLLFTSAGFAATKMGFTKKKKEGLQEGRNGERTHKNVLGVGIAPCIFAIASYFAGDGHSLLLSIGFISSITVAASDTIASEIGVRDKRVWMITTFKEVSPGTDGGISLFGTMISLIGSFAVAVMGWLILYRSFDMFLIIPGIAGFFGCLLDSVFGATLETKGYISKYVNNASTAVIGALFGMALALPFI